MLRLSLLAILLIASLNSYTQSHEDEGGHKKHGHHINPSDTLPPKLGFDLDKGSFEFHARSFFMQTINKGNLLDYNALGMGAGIGYYSPSWKGFHFGFSGFFVFQLFENNIYEEDLLTNNINRYEILLFDMNDFENKRDLDRLEELYLLYENKDLEVILGRQTFESPLLNEQDNRMRANLFSGLTLNYSPNHWDFRAAWFHATTIRGTVEWYSMEESFGVYPFGRTPFGTASEYKENIETHGVGIVGVKYKKNNFYTEGWNYFNENVFNIAFAQSEYKLRRKTFDYYFGAQGFYQSALNNGGNHDPEKAYIIKGEQSYGVGGRLGIGRGNHSLTLNYLNISDEGRFLFPREWGREQFFASLPRERFEGSGDVSSMMLKYTYAQEDKGWLLEFGASKVDHADLNEYSNNKYGIPSYFHFTGLVDYRFKGYLEGLDLKLLVAYKAAQNPGDVPDDYRINRVDLWNFNFIIDFRF
jgi:hypothetical protein